jgi:hypothetical protein
MTLIVAGVVIYGVMIALFWLFLRGVSVIEEEEEEQLCSEPMAECANCHKC